MMYDRSPDAIHCHLRSLPGRVRLPGTERLLILLPDRKDGHPAAFPVREEGGVLNEPIYPIFRPYLMPSLSMRARRVLGLMPSSSAVPPGP